MSWLWRRRVRLLKTYLAWSVITLVAHHVFWDSRYQYAAFAAGPLGEIDVITLGAFLIKKTYQGVNRLFYLVNVGAPLFGAQILRLLYGQPLIREGVSLTWFQIWPIWYPLYLLGYVILNGHYYTGYLMYQLSYELNLFTSPHRGWSYGRTTPTQVYCAPSSWANYFFRVGVPGSLEPGTSGFLEPSVRYLFLPISAIIIRCTVAAWVPVICFFCGFFMVNASHRRRWSKTFFWWLRFNFRDLLYCLSALGGCMFLTAIVGNFALGLYPLLCLGRPAVQHLLQGWYEILEINPPTKGWWTIFSDEWWAKWDIPTIRVHFTLSPRVDYILAQVERVYQGWLSYEPPWGVKIFNDVSGVFLISRLLLHRYVLEQGAYSTIGLNSSQVGVKYLYLTEMFVIVPAIKGVYGLILLYHLWAVLGWNIFSVKTLATMLIQRGVPLEGLCHELLFFIFAGTIYNWTHYKRIFLG